MGLRHRSDPPRVAARLIVAVSGLVLLALVGIGPAAWLASAHSALPPQGEPRPAPAPNRSMPLGLRAGAGLPRRRCGAADLRDRRPSCPARPSSITRSTLPLARCRSPSCPGSVPCSAGPSPNGLRNEHALPVRLPPARSAGRRGASGRADAEQGRRDQRPGRVVDLAGGAPAGHRRPHPRHGRGRGVRDLEPASADRAQLRCPAQPGLPGGLRHRRVAGRDPNRVRAGGRAVRRPDAVVAARSVPDRAGVLAV